ncbi:MAG TPA: hypothetical protein VJM83_02380, partial [Nitrospirota bacterium]|nr:hypothetical protein [Nitrospirota bacterium]
VEKMALANPAVHFRLTNNGREVLDCPPVKALRDRVAQVYGREFAAGLAEVGLSRGSYAVNGFVSRPGVSFADKTRQESFVNGRPVKSPAITRALYDAFQSAVMKDRHPAAILFIKMDPALVDVNVHPAKREVRFAENHEVHRLVFDAVTQALGASPASGRARESEADNREGVREAVESYIADARPDRFSHFAGRDHQPTQERMRLPQEWRDRPDAAHAPETASSAYTHFEPYPMQVADSYIIVPSDEGYMVIDQHAAHERVQYEKVKARHKDGAGSQGLLVPEGLDLTAKEAALMRGLVPELAATGIEVEDFGGGSFLIRSKPLFLEKADIKEIVLGILADVEDSDVRGKAEGLREKVFQLIACKSAVKAGVRLHPEAMKRLISQLFACEMPYTCAHGRPTVIKFSMSELEKMFKRK